MSPEEEFVLASDGYARARVRLERSHFETLDELRAAYATKNNAKRDFMRAWKRWKRSR